MPSGASSAIVVDAATAPRERIRALVGALGGCEHSIRVGDRWVEKVGLPLDAWRTADGTVHTGARRCELVLPEGASVEAIAPWSIVELEFANDADAACRLPPDERFPRAPVTWLHRIVAVGVPDADLERIARERQVPVHLDHPRLGRFEYDRKLGWFEGSVDWNGRTVSLSLGCADPGQTERILAHADALLARWPEWQQRAPAFAAERLLALKNEHWSGEDDDGEELPPITHGQFVACLTPNSVGIEETGEVSFWFDDGDLFFGHSIHVNGTLDGTLDDAGIAG